MSLTRLLSLAILVITTGTQAVFLTGASFFVIGPELGISPKGLGLLTAAFFGVAAISSMSIGSWVQRVGWQRAMRANGLIAASTSIGIALFARSPVALAGFMAAAAVGYGVANPAGNQAIADAVPPDRRATVTAMKHAGIPLATLLAGASVPTIVVTFGWRTAFAVAGVGALLVVVAVPRGLVAPRAFEGRERQRPTRVLTGRDLTWLATGSALAVFAATSLGAFGVSAAIDLGLGAEAAGWLQTGGAAASIGMRVLAGWLTDRFHGRGPAGIIVLAGAGVLVFAAMAVALPPAFTVLMVLAYATGWGWPGLLTFTVINSNTGTAAKSTSVTQAGVFIGSAVAPLILGAVADEIGFRAMWPIVSVALAAAVVVIGMVARSLTRQAEVATL